MSARLWVVTVVGILAVGLLVAGCGDDDSEVSTIPKATFVKKGIAICTKRSQEISTTALKVIGEGGKSPAKTKAATVEAYGSIVVPDLEAELEEIRALGVPKGEEERTEEAFDAWEEMLDNASDDVAKFADTVQPFTKAEVAADKIGLENCPMGV